MQIKEVTMICDDFDEEYFDVIDSLKELDFVEIEGGEDEYEEKSIQEPDELFSLSEIVLIGSMSGNVFERRKKRKKNK